MVVVVVVIVVVVVVVVVIIIIICLQSLNIVFRQVGNRAGKVFGGFLRRCAYNYNYYNKIIISIIIK